MASSSEKPPTIVDDSTSETLKSAISSIDEKAGEAENSVREGSQTPEPTASNANAARVSTDSGLRRVHSTTKDVQDEITRVMTSGEGVEYPTGVKLGLISLALCLSVFLIALVCVARISLQIHVLILLVLGQHHYRHGYS